MYKETGTIIPAPNSRFAKAGVSCFYDSEVLNSSFVQLMKFSAENPRLRKAAKRCIQYIFRTYAESFSPIFSE
ncbi:hypothetical protein GFJ94_00345 [Flavobacterium sp. LMO8]|nr:hypothetical protein [Flavobacterium sp. LMO8]